MRPAYYTFAMLFVIFGGILFWFAYQEVLWLLLFNVCLVVLFSSPFLGLAILFVRLIRKTDEPVGPKDE